MKKYVIVADVTCDLNENIRKRFDIEYIKGHMTLPNGEERQTTLDWSLMKKEDFYNSLKDKKNVYTTAPANIDECKEAFINYIKQGYDILSISISSGLSGTYNFACKAREEALKEYLDANIKCLNSLRYSNGLGLICIYASLLREQGKTLDETYAYLEENKNCFHQMGWLDDLSFVASKGRISHSAAFFGQMIGIKPLGDTDYNGLTTVIGKAKGEKQAFNAIIAYIKATIVNPQDQIILIAQTNREKPSLKLKELIEKEIKPKEIILSDVFIADGINIGPGLMAAFYFGKPISKEGLQEEKNLMASILGK